MPNQNNVVKLNVQPKTVFENYRGKRITYTYDPKTDRWNAEFTEETHSIDTFYRDGKRKQDAQRAIRKLIDRFEDI